eukprot:10386385-Lingulodinium_polyedra.AAC.1
MVATAVEPSLSDLQTAKKGGGCHVNVRRAFQHLGSVGGCPPFSHVEQELWEGLLGDAAEPIARL